MDELKNTIVTVEQGGLNLDDSVMSIPEGDSREVSNVMIYENGKAEGMLGYEKVHTVTNGKTIENACTDEQGRVYVVEATGSFRVYRNGVLILETDEVLFDKNKYVQVECHDGYLFVTQSGYEPLMIDVEKNVDFIDRTYKEGISKSSTDGKLLFLVNYLDWYSEFSVGETVSVICSSVETNKGGKNGGGEILDITKIGIYMNIKIDQDIEDLNGEGSGCIVSGTTTYFPFYENLTTIKPTPQKAPEIEMLSDSSIGYNNFVENTYVFGYTVVYDDDYETPMSPLSVVNLESLSVSSIQRSNVNAYNKARIYIVPPPTAKKVKLFVKKNSESESFYRISTNDFKSEIAVLWDGSLVEDVYSNDEWAKGFESVPQSAKTFGYLSDDRIVYGGCTEGYNCDKPKIFATYTTTEYDVDISRTIVPSYISTVTGLRNGVYLEFITKLGFSSATTVGSFKFESTCLVAYRVGVKIVLSVTVDIEIGDSPTDILYKVIDEINFRYNDSSMSEEDRVFAQEYPFGYINLSMYKIGYVIYSVEAEMDYYFGKLAFAKTQKTGYEEQYGVVWKDRAGRSSGVLTNESCKVTYPEYDATEKIVTSKPIIYLNATPPSWATCYQFVVKRNLKSWSQHIVPCKETDGTWGTTSPADSKGINIFITTASNTYGIAFNRIIKPDVENSTNQLVYQYKEGDYVRLIRTYTPTGWSNNVNSKMFRITGTKTEDSITYFMIDDTDGNFDDIYDLYTSTSNTYLQFEIVNTGDMSFISDNVWNEIGDSYGLISGLNGSTSTQTYPEDNQSYTFYEHEVDYGRAVVRPVYGANLDLENYVEWIFFVESEYIFDGSNKKLLITGRPHVITKNEQVFRNIVRVGGRKFDDTEIDNRRVFDFMDYTTVGDNYGDITRVIQRGNSLRVYCPRRTGSIYLNADEVSYQDGSSNLVYSANKLGKMRWNDSKYGCSEFKHIVSSGNSIYFFDTNVKEFLVDTTGGIFGMSGKSGDRDFKMQSFFNTTSFTCGYDPFYRMVWATNDTQTVAFFEDYGRWKSFYTIAPTLYFNHSNQLYSLNNNGVFKHHVSGYNTYNSSGTLSNTDPVFDLAIGAERPLTRNYESVVLHSDDKYDVYVNCYTKNWTDDLYTKIPSGTFKKWEDLFYADVTKGGKESTFKSYMMYEGKDMVGKVGIFKVVGDMGLSAIEVRYSNRIK